MSERRARYEFMGDLLAGSAPRLTDAELARIEALGVGGLVTAAEQAALIAEVKRLRAEVEELRAALDDAQLRLENMDVFGEGDGSETSGEP